MCRPKGTSQQTIPQDLPLQKATHQICKDFKGPPGVQDKVIHRFMFIHKYTPP